jgi:hypothetical protein
MFGSPSVGATVIFVTGSAAHKCLGRHRDGASQLPLCSTQTIAHRSALAEAAALRISTRPISAWKSALATAMSALPLIATDLWTSRDVSNGRVEDGRGSLGHSATLRSPSPLIEPDVPD